MIYILGYECFQSKEKVRIEKKLNKKRNYLLNLYIDSSTASAQQAGTAGHCMATVVFKGIKCNHKSRN